MIPIKVFVIDDLEITRYGLINIIDDGENFHVAGEAPDLSSAVGLIRSSQPDVVMIDISLPGTNCSEAAEKISSICPGTEIIFLYLPEESRFVIEALQDGERRFVSKNADKHELHRAIQCAAAGGKYFDKNIFESIRSEDIENLITGRGKLNGAILSVRETQVLKLMYGGLHNKEIAGILGIGVRTVEKYKSNIIQKMGIKGNGRLYQNIYKSLASSKV